MKIQSAAVAAATSDYARETRARAALKQLAEARKREVSDDTAKVRSGPRFAAAESRKAQAKAKLQQVREWLKIVKKLFAQNPTGMAKALAQVFKDLKGAVAAYKDAGGEEMGATGDAVGAVLSANEPAKDDAEAPDGDVASPVNEAPPVAEDAKVAPADNGEPDPAARAAEGRSLYEAVAGEVRKQVGEDGLDFLKEVRGMVDDIKKLLETARGQAAIRRHDKASDEAFEDADKALKDLDETMSQMENQIHRDAPTAGMTLSVAA
jgi:hypothetical protein